MTTSTSESNKKGKSITNRLFKRNRTTEMDEFQTYIYHLHVMKMLIYLNGGK